MTRATEQERILEVYRRRKEEIPLDFYALTQPDVLLRYQQRTRYVIEGLRRHGLLPLADKRILELGCGRGDALTDWIRWGATPSHLAGIDLDEERLEFSRTLFGNQSDPPDLRVGDAGALPWPDNAFDIVQQSTVFSSILDAALRERVAAEMVRVLRPGGAILWYDFFVNNPNNPQVRGIPRSELRALFPGATMRSHRITLAPPVARWVAPHAYWLAAALQSLPLACTHNLAFIEPKHG